MVSRKKWSKSSDWIPLSNAKAQVKFWEWDLALAKDYLKKVQTYEKYGFKFYDTMLKIAQMDVKISENSLVVAKAKLKESEGLE